MQLGIVLIYQFSEETLQVTNFLIFSVSSVQSIVYSFSLFMFSF